MENIIEPINTWKDYLSFVLSEKITPQAISQATGVSLISTQELIKSLKAGKYPKSQRNFLKYRNSLLKLYAPVPLKKLPPKNIPPALQYK